MRRVLVLSSALATLLLSACDPKDAAGPSQTDTGPDDPPADPPAEPGRFTLAISASDSDPYLLEGPRQTGPYDLYLWLVCANYGLTRLGIDLEATGDSLVAEHFFSPAPSVASVTWDSFSRLDVAVTGCPQSETLLGALHLEGSGAGGRICMVRTSGTAGARLCETGDEMHDVSCLGHSSDGSTPCIAFPEDGCLDHPAPVHNFAISASDTNWNVRTGPPITGLYTLYLWSLGGSFSAFQGEIHVFGGDEEASPSFAVRSPYIGLSTTGGPDVLVAVGGCPSGTALVGTILINGTGNGAWVTMSQGLRGGIADCGNTGKFTYRCLPYSSLTP